MAASINPLTAVWSGGRTALCGWIAAPSVITAEALVSAGWDAIVFDLQHGTADYASLLAMLPVVQRSGAAPIVRVPWLDEGDIMRALDAGALGVIAPMIESPEDVARLVRSCRYPPDGGRSFGPVRAGYAWGPSYIERANADILSLAMIETRRAVEALDEILSVDGLGGVYLGPADLALSHGYPPGFDRREPEMTALILSILERCKGAGVRCCLHCGSPDYAAEMACEGFDLVTVGSDVRFLEAGARAAVRRFRQSAARNAGRSRKNGRSKA